jgi:hypothetical protein
VWTLWVSSQRSILRHAPDILFFIILYFYCLIEEIQWLITCRITINQNLLVLAIKLTNSTTIVTALSNLTPQSTFIVAILSRSMGVSFISCSPIKLFLGTNLK